MLGKLTLEFYWYIFQLFWTSCMYTENCKINMKKEEGICNFSLEFLTLSESLILCFAFSDFICTLNQNSIFCPKTVLSLSLNFRTAIFCLSKHINLNFRAEIIFERKCSNFCTFKYIKIVVWIFAPKKTKDLVWIFVPKIAAILYFSKFYFNLNFFNVSYCIDQI